jgi:HEPN domain-containing protein
MKPNEINAKQFITKAIYDLQVANLLIENNFFDHASFISHQAAQKSLRAILINSNKKVNTISDLLKLTAMIHACDINVNSTVEEACEELNGFGNPISKHHFPIDEKKAKHMLSCATLIVAFGNLQLKELFELTSSEEQQSHRRPQALIEEMLTAFSR